MSDADPIRLREAGSGASDELRRAIEEARDVPGERLARVAKRLGSGGPGPGSGPGPGAAVSRLRTIGVVGAAVVAVGVGLGAWRLLGPARDSEPVPPRRAAAPTADIVRRAAEPVPDVVAGPAPAAAPIVAQPPRASPPAAEAESEAQLLLRARRALSTSASRAIELVREHERQFPHAEHVEEREALRVEALVASGRTDEARGAYERFRGRFSGSAHLEHLSQLISAGGP